MLGSFEKTVREAMDESSPSWTTRRTVVAVSGGPDSMALLHALARIRLLASGSDLVVAHFDHGLRGADSEADAEFVTMAADRLGLACSVGREDVAAHARARGRNLEAVARELRYEFLARVAERTEANYVVTGHTANDQAETVLMRLGRGAGVDGLAGIAPARPLKGGALLVRPLLALGRAEVLAYCAEREIPYRTDATNADVAFTRACVRHEVLPRLERVMPEAATNIARAAAHAADDRAYFAEIVERTLRAWNVAESGRIALPAAEVATLAPALRRRVLREAFRRAHGDLKRLTAAHVQTLERLLMRPGGGADLPYGVRARRVGDFLVVDGAGGKSG